MASQHGSRKMMLSLLEFARVSHLGQTSFLSLNDLNASSLNDRLRATTSSTYQSGSRTAHCRHRVKIVKSLPRLIRLPPAESHSPPRSTADCTHHRQLPATSALVGRLRVCEEPCKGIPVSSLGVFFVLVMTTTTSRDDQLILTIAL